ncbi:hypothetical protein DFH06DRAFT_1462593 [Mycena polygramma]|nr:hypothetical protein DFH06DRAFT_1462593 [Mycena polygramma]
MVLTRRAYKSISRWLPNEIISEIAEVASSSDLAALCRTCKLFHAIGTPVLYRAVYLRSESVEGFCSTVLNDTAKFAGLVRSFATSKYYIVIPDFQQSSMFKCLKTLSRLENLSIDGYGLHTARRKAMSCTFPHLLRCILSIKDRHWTSLQQEYSVVSFLIRHPALKSIEIVDSLHAEIWPSTSARIPLLNLERIRAPPRFLPSVFASGLREARLEWLERDPIEPVFSILGPMTRSDVPFVYSNFCYSDQCAEIVDSMSRNVPYVRTLHMDASLLDETWREETIEHLMESLPRFTDLESFGIQTVSGRHPRATFGEDEAQDQIVVQGFGNVCLTLRMCRLNTNAWRKINGIWERFPVEDFAALAGITFPL